MAILFEKTDRLIIPRWREYNRLAPSAEHLPLQNDADQIHTDVPVDVFAQRKIWAWNQRQDLGNAWDLVNTAYVDHNFPIAIDAARFLKGNSENLHVNLRKIIAEILGEEYEKTPINDSDAVGLSSIREVTRKKLHHVKAKLSTYIRNEFAWLELARLYAILGVNDKARKCIIVAVELSDKNNRYILRAASRFYFHMGEFEAAQYTVRLSPFFKKDPWLLSADLSYCNKMKRKYTFGKHSLNLVESKNFNPASISELSGMLAKVEFENKSLKSARKLTKTSLLAPNDNSLAQAEWISREMGDISVRNWIDEIKNGYEARAYDNFYLHAYNKSIEEGISWILDQPFSKRACSFVTYVCTALTDNQDLGIEVGKHGLTCNPNNFNLLNNVAFAYATKGDVLNAEKYLAIMHSVMSGEQELCFYFATKGLLHFRKNEPELGRQYYLDAITIAEKSKKNHALKVLAEAYLIRESALANLLPIGVALDAMRKLNVDNKLDIKNQIQHITRSLEKSRSFIL
ncbi:MAG: hypothetical protein P0Y53_00090 [Candidatus Pseudobacter hemicellulosilyticus]|uniref:Tetratricopeptide repeat protein n=1 Tax=Candidatus Pseudobacter hemicellulosilyticus TaxID=3121375 RepID=A0AAJ5WUH2_9BACT|nr:MAG: hypothetical protein P0Y53_00090 [Pseudobacter sp.]